MRLNIDFFSKDMLKALESGIYQVEVERNGRKDVLYIGESVYLNVRCAEHLYNLKNNPEYFGFTSRTIDDPSISLIFSILESEDDMATRKAREKELVKEKRPISQSGISDRLSVQRTNALNDWLSN